MKDLVKEFSDVVLTAEQEAALAKRIQDGSEQALVDLVMANMRRAILYTQRVDRGRADLSTVVSLCYQELCMSAKRFNPKLGRFFAASKAGLRGRVLRYWNSLRVVRNQSEQISLEALAKPAQDRVVSSKGSSAVRDLLLSEDSDATRADNWWTAVRELTTGEISEDGTKTSLDKDQWAAVRKQLDSTLSENQWMIIELAYKGRLNFGQIGALLGVSRAFASKCHVEAMKKLRNAVKDKELLDKL